MDVLLKNLRFLKITIILIVFLNNYLFSLDLDSLKNELNSSDKIKRIELLNQLANGYINNDINKSIKYANMALDLSKKLNIIKSQLEANLTLANNYFKNGNIDEAKQIAVKSIELATKIESDFFVAKFFHILASLNKYIGEYKNALKYYFNALRIWEKDSNDLEKGKIFRNIGDVYKLKGQYDKSIEFLLSALEISESIGNKLDISDINSVIGQVYYYLNNFDEALKYHNKALSQVIELDEKQSIAISYSNIGMVHLAQNDLLKAIESYNKALIIDLEIGDKIGENIEYSNLAIIYSRLGQFDKSLKYNKLSLNLERLAGNNIGIAQSLNNIGKVYLKKGKLDRSLKTTLDAYSLILKEDAPEASYNICSELAQIYFMKQNYAKGSHFFSRFVTIKDSLFSDKMSKSIGEIRTKYELEKKEKQIFSLIRDKEIKKLEIEKQKLIKNLFIAAFIMSIILLGTIYRFYNLKVRSNERVNSEKMNALLELEKRVKIEKILRKSQVEVRDLNKDLEKEISKKKNELEDTVGRLKESEKILIRQEKLVSLGTMLAGIAHEINNPAQAIRFSLDALSLNARDLKSFISETIKLSKNDSFNVEDKLSVLLGLIHQYELEDMLKEIDSFVTENKKTVGMIESIVNSTKKLSYSNITFTTFDINHLLLDSLNLVNNQIKYSARVELELEDEIPKVTGLYQELGQVFINLLVNAKDAILEKKINQKDAEIRIVTSFVPEVNKVRVKIIDNGIGIKNENLEKIFEPFFTTKKINKGIGLGLNIVQRIIESHHGQIELQSSENEGTVFYIYLPV